MSRIAQYRIDISTKNYGTVLGLSRVKKIAKFFRMEKETDGVQVATRLDRALYAKIVKRQKEAKKLTGVEPSISAIVRAVLEEALGGKRKPK